MDDEPSKTFKILEEAEALVERARDLGLPRTGSYVAWSEIRRLSGCIWQPRYPAKLHRAADPLPSDLEIIESPDGVLESTFTTFNVRLLDGDGETILAQRLGSIQLISQSGPLDVTPMFELKDGTIGLKDIASFRRALNKRFDPFRLSVRAFNGDKQYEGTADFAIGRFGMRVRLQRPPATKVSLRSVPVWLMSDRTSLIFQGVTNADGIAEFSSLPDDHYRIASAPDLGGKRYYGRTEVELDREAGIVDLPLVATAHDIERRAGDQGFWRDENEHAEWTHMFSAYLGLANRTSLETFDANFESGFDSDYPTASESEAALHEALEHDRKKPLNPDERTIVFRVYDARGRVVYRGITALKFAQWTSNGRSEIAK
ncbi:MAG TPA: hypothetical protein VHU41_09135, partial [Thermoanaerobaculia bacterium]|nr:hypothetical protein [Thermoanaerobaculia bacterium]